MTTPDRKARQRLGPNKRLHTLDRAEETRLIRHARYATRRIDELATERAAMIDSRSETLRRLADHGWSHRELATVLRVAKSVIQGAIDPEGERLTMRRYRARMRTARDAMQQ